MRIDDIVVWFKKWCVKTRRGGGVLIGSSIHELLSEFDAQPERAIYSEKYLNWVKSEKERLGDSFRPLTSGQHVFVEWCIKNRTVVSEIGERDKLFSSIRIFLKK